MKHKQTTQLFSFSLLTILAVAPVCSAYAAKTESSPPSTAPNTFAPLPEDDPLASIWNDPDFTRRRIGSYGFLSAAEPELRTEDQIFLRDKVQSLIAADPSTAIPVLESKLTEKLPPNPAAQFHFLLGNIYFQQSELTNAIEHFKAALGNFPDFHRAQKNLGFALVLTQNYPEAIKALTRTVTLGASDSKVFGLLAYSYMNEGMTASAETSYQQAMILEPNNTDFKLGAVKCAIANENYERALSLLKELINQHPDRENLWSLQANLFIAQQKTEQAALSLEMLRRLGKANPKSLYLLGDLYMNQEARDLALSTYMEAVQLDGGKNPTAALRPAQILVRRGATDEATKLFDVIRQAGGLSSKDELSLLKLEAQVAGVTGQGEKSISLLEEIIQKDPLDGEALLLAGDYYAQHEQPELASRRFERAETLDEFQADALVKHAQLLVQAQDYRKAVELLTKAQKIKPRDNVQRFLEKIEKIGTGAK